MPLKSERNEAGTNASKIRGTPKGTDRSFSVPFASRFGEIFQNFHKIYAIFVLYWVYLLKKWVKTSKLTNANLLLWKLLILKVRPAARGVDKERKKERKKERRSSLKKRNEAGTNASILAKERGRNAFLKNEERSMLCEFNFQYVHQIMNPIFSLNQAKLLCFCLKKMNNLIKKFKYTSFSFCVKAQIQIRLPLLDTN